MPIRKLTVFGIIILNNRDKLMQEKWNNKFADKNYLFGKEPNPFFKEEIDKINNKGKALFIGEGEGRNSVYAAKLGWNVDAIDFSSKGKEKAERLAKEKNVKMNYLIKDAFTYNYPKNYYDCIALIYFHVEEEKREKFYKKVLGALKSNGTIINLVYDKENLSVGSSGPDNLQMLYTLSDLVETFIDLEFLTFGKNKIKRKNDKHSVVIKFSGRKEI
ncbi:MAG: SAM-dependent methyltransferase [Ignavibacteriae bacterium]|nr:MAG: SAM-dependent methyltransferase [Ignavibacteriota bacterium]